MLVGNREWMKRSGLCVEPDVNAAMNRLEVTGQTVVLCAINGKCLWCVNSAWPSLCDVTAPI